MAKRFIETGFFKSPFVRRLKAPLKTLYLFIICDCEGSGIWAKDLEIASFYIGYKVTEDDFLLFVDAKKAVDLGNGKFFFPDFIEHQYPSGLQHENRAHKNFIEDLLKFNLLDDNLRPLIDPSKGLLSPTGNGNGLGNGLGNGNTSEEKKVFELTLPFNSPEFLEKWNLLKSEPKWRKKTINALQLSLNKLAKYPEDVAIQMMDDAISGAYQGLFEPKNYTNGTDRKFTTKHTGAEQLAEIVRQRRGI